MMKVHTRIKNNQQYKKNWDVVVLELYTNIIIIV